MQYVKQFINLIFEFLLDSYLFVRKLTIFYLSGFTAYEAVYGVLERFIKNS